MQSPPHIPLIPSNYVRPLWSVMIPTFNCAHLLRETLESVLVQDPGPDQMQIEVVDDCSTKDDPEKVVEEVGKGRVSFYRQPKNQGVTKNFNSCVLRSRGFFVHILHGDDLVTPAFYSTLEGLAKQFPSAALLATRAFHIDESGEIDSLNDRLPSLASPSTNASPFYYNNPFRTPAMVIRRDFYETHGGFYETLCHTADWEMWVRAIALGSGVVINRPLAKYRWFAGNDTSKLMRTGENLRDYLRLAEILTTRHPDFDMAKFRYLTARIAKHQAKRFAEKGDLAARDANQVLHDSLVIPPKRMLRRIEFAARYRLMRPIARMASGVLRKRAG